MRSAPLDGVRAVAVVAVLAYHARYPWAVGGYLGVDVFFVLSGYLITRVLLSTHRSWWGYRQFLVRRAVRLVPALVAAAIGMTLVGLVTGIPAAQVGRCSTASLGYLMNLDVVERWKCPPMWHITWSLAAEQQFYLVWPLALSLLALTLRGHRPPGRGRGLLLGATCCLFGFGLEMLRQLSVRQDGDVQLARRLMFAPEGRSLVLLLGCALALLEARSPRPRSARLRLPGAAAGAALVVLLVCFTKGRLGNAPFDLVPLLVAGLGSVVLIAAVVRAPTTSVAVRLLGARPVAWLGRVSYGLYLWHEVAYRLGETVATRGTPVAEATRLGLALLLAAASHAWVEQPAQRWWTDRRTRSEEEPDRVRVATS